MGDGTGVMGYGEVPITCHASRVTRNPSALTSHVPFRAQASVALTARSQSRQATSGIVPGSKVR